MRVRHIVGLGISAVTVPVAALSVLDPMEGGLALLVAGVLLLVTWLVSRVPVPRLTWIAWVSTASAGVVSLTVAAILWSQGVTGPGSGLPWGLWVLIVLYETGAITTFAGYVWYLIRHIGVVRHDARANRGNAVAGLAHQ